ncbi:substrate-binding domain-containing protein [Streptomyces diastatochromogenes]|uniref:substrate-binding domain-containing protein n=1 Tax=Streptomyces diastatochromogenes TaxID=42236 RepID=UPI0036973102
MELVFRELESAVEIIRGVERVVRRNRIGVLVFCLSRVSGYPSALVQMDPPLTTVHQPPAEMATAATELALALGRGEEVPQVGLEIATTLTVRESTAPPKEE